MNDPQKNMLMIFVRNARIGRVKTRLAATVGNERALEIYIRLLDYTAEVCRSVHSDKAVFYADFIEEVDEFDIPVFQKYLQRGEDLGEKMKNAFVKSFAKGYEKVIVIGSDCFEINSKIIEMAFDSLNDHDIVAGPAKDGGYYLLGMKRLYSAFFENKIWSTSNVFLDTLLDIKQLNLTYYTLPVLNDIDEESDLPEELRNHVS